jgi:hypothetical protein
MATTTKKAPTKKAASAKGDGTRGSSSNGSRKGAPSLSEAAKDIEHEVSRALRRELREAKKLLDGVERDVKRIGKRISATVEDLAARDGVGTQRASRSGAKDGKRSVAKKPAAKKPAAKKTAARTS